MLTEFEKQLQDLGRVRDKLPDQLHKGKIFSVTNTCLLDTGLFVLWHAYKAGIKKFRSLFESEALAASVAVRRTFQHVESDGWTTARLYWLVRHGLFKDKSEGDE